MPRRLFVRVRHGIHLTNHPRNETEIVGAYFEFVRVNHNTGLLLTYPLGVAACGSTPTGSGEPYSHPVTVPSSGSKSSCGAPVKSATRAYTSPTCHGDHPHTTSKIVSNNQKLRPLVDAHHSAYPHPRSLLTSAMAPTFHFPQTS